jgi:hypothetical protein
MPVDLTGANASSQQICSGFSSRCGSVEERYDERSMALLQQRVAPPRVLEKTST